MIKVSLRASFVTAAVIMVMVTSGVVGYISYVGSSIAVDDVTRRLQSEIATRVTEHLDHFLGLPQAALEQSARLIADGIVAPNDQPGLQRLMFNQVAIHPALTSLYFANRQGGLAGAGHEGRHQAFYTTGTRDFVPGPFIKQAVGGDGRSAETLLTLPGYDARDRPWYQAALKAPPGQGVWGGLYLLFTGHDLALAASRAVHDANGRLLGVVGADIFTSQIKEFLSDLHSNVPGLTFITDQDGLLISTSNGEAPFGLDAEGEPANRVAAREAGNPVIAASAQAPSLVRTGRRAFKTDVRVDGRVYIVYITPFSDARGLDWRINTVVPRDAFTAPIQAGNLRTLALVILAAAGMAIVAILLMRRVLEPLRQAAVKAEAVGRGDLSVSLDANRPDEIGALGRAFNFMVERLRLAQSEQSRQMAALSAAEVRFRSLFHGTATAQCTEDLSGVMARLDDLRAQGVTDIAAWLRDDPARLDDLAGRARITDMNNAMRRLLDMPLPETAGESDGAEAGRDIRPLFGEGAAELLVEGTVALWEGHPGFQGETRLRTASGRERDVMLTMPVPPTRAGFKAVPLSFVDLTERKAAEATLRAKNAELERSNAELESFAHVAAHDLREPLRTIGSYATLLRRRAKDRLSHDEIEFLDFIHDGAQRMDSLVNDLLDFARVGRSARQFGPVALDTVVQSALAGLQARLEETGATVEVAGELPVVWGLADDLDRVFINLIANAIKYRAEHRPLRVTLSARAVSRDEGPMPSGAAFGGWEVCVTDNGIGFSPGLGYEDRIFGLFQRLHGRHAHGGGTGIGLAICKKVIEFHGGRITAESAGDDRGCTIRFTLPAAPDTA